ncbi:hypothetical protein B0H11DRAFT_2229126 [Mycena galericulata]|nr:hypothetical protein B0H11DRAFT_2229126 [Mycena galericulata]
MSILCLLLQPLAALSQDTQFVFVLLRTTGLAVLLPLARFTELVEFALQRQHGGRLLLGTRPDDGEFLLHLPHARLAVLELAPSRCSVESCVCFVAMRKS